MMRGVYLKLRSLYSWVCNQHSFEIIHRSLSFARTLNAAPACSQPACRVIAPQIKEQLYIGTLMWIL